MHRDRFFEALGAATALGLLAYACLYERHNLELTEQTVHLARLPKALDGLRIVQLSDFHFKHYAEASYVRHVVDRVNTLRPDLVLLTGDYVTEGTVDNRRRSAELSIPLAGILAHIECKHRWAVLGNHDEMVGPNIVRNALVAHGFPVLNNSYASFERGGARLWIAGIDSSSRGRPGLDAAVPEKLKASGDPVLLLAHEPDFAEEVAGHGGVDLMLSGHTHGGQIRLPLIGPPKLPPMGRKYIEGLFSLHGDLQLYVNRGIGAMKLPARFMCRPEITLFTLRSGS